MEDLEEEEDLEEDPEEDLEEDPRGEGNIWRKKTWRTTQKMMKTQKMEELKNPDEDPLPVPLDTGQEDREQTKTDCNCECKCGSVLNNGRAGTVVMMGE